MCRSEDGAPRATSPTPAGPRSVAASLLSCAMRTKHLPPLKLQSCCGCFPLEVAWLRQGEKGHFSWFFSSNLNWPLAVMTPTTCIMPSSARWCPAPSAHPEPCRQSDCCRSLVLQAQALALGRGWALYFCFPSNSCFQELPPKGEEGAGCKQPHPRLCAQPRAEAEGQAPEAVGSTSQASLPHAHLHQLTLTTPLLSHCSEGSVQELYCQSSAWVTEQRWGKATGRHREPEWPGINRCWEVG